MKKLIYVFIITFGLFSHNIFAQFDWGPTSVELGDINQNSYVEFTLTLFSWAPDGTTYTVTTNYPWPEWLDVEPMEFTLNFAQEQEVVCSGYCADFVLGDHAASLEVEDDDPNFPNWNWTQIWWTSHPTGFEDYFNWLDFDDDFYELDPISYSIEFVDEYPTSPPVDWSFKMILYGQDGEYIYYQDIGNGPQPQTWQFDAPLLPQDNRFVRTENGEIKGRVFVETVDIYGWVNDISRAFKIKKEPSQPLFHIQSSGVDEIDLHFQNDLNGATTYEVYYDDDPNPPFNGIGLDQGESPILTSNVSSLNLSGLNQCTDYYFAIKAINSYGESELSDVKKVVVFDTPNSLPIYYHHNDLIVESNKTVISENYCNFYLGDLIVEAGTDIIFEDGTVYFDEESKLIIEPTGKLTLDGTTVTAPCDQTWMGIEVWGDPYEHQYTISDVCSQGIIELKGGATIENAVIGVLLASKDENGNIEDTKTGGIIRIDFDGDETEFEANFINNQRGIYFYDYKNYGPFDPNEREVSNLSFIEHAYFEVNQDYLMGDWWHSHIYLYKVLGVKIRGNTFINNEANIPSGHGINSYNAGYRVEAICDDIISPCPETSLIKNKFWNFTKGINLVNTSTRSLFVKEAEFHNNSGGVILNSVDNPIVIFNDFFLGECSDGDDQKCDGKGAAYGIDMYSCTGFKVEENEFEKESGAPAGNYIGIRVTDCASESEIIYRNKFNGISIGNLAEGANRILNYGSNSGVTYQCNENIGNNYDFYVASNSFISGFVGDYDEASGNTLSSAAQVQFQNDYTEPVLYFFNQNASNEVLTLYSNYVVPLGINDENTCPSNYGGAGVPDPRAVLTETERQETELEYLQNYNNFSIVEILYNDLQDGGNTEGLKTEVETSWPQNMWELRAELLGNSPHLSQEVLKTAADKTDVLPESVLFEILSANPDELRKEELISYLENKAEPLPQYMIDILKQLANGSTYKTVLMSEMASYHAKKVKAAQDIITSILNEEEPDMSDLRDWYDNIGGIEADKKIVETFIMEGDNVSAQSLLDLIPTLYELSGDQLSAYNDYKSYTELVMDLETEERSIFDLDTDELAMLLTMAESSLGSAKASAQGILEFAYGYDFCNCPDLPSNIQLKSTTIDMDDFAKARGLEVSVEPNPASTWTAINYTLPVAESSGLIEITDNLGRTIIQVEISNQTGQYILDTREFKTGLYYYTITCNDLQRSGKLIIR